MTKEDHEWHADTLREFSIELQKLSPTSQTAFRNVTQGAQRATKELQGLRTELKTLSEGFKNGFARAFNTAFDSLITRGNSVSDVLRGLALDMGRVVAQQAVSNVSNGLAQKATGVMGNLMGSLFSSTPIRAFARGGVVDGPALFPLGRGAGLMGEAGPEAILPLRRGADGALGVAAGGGGGPQIVVNISTPDVESFRRSRGQVASALARAVDRGRRNQ